MKNNNEKVPQLCEEVKKLNGKSSKNLQKKIGEMIETCKPAPKKESKDQS